MPEGMTAAGGAPSPGGAPPPPGGSPPGMGGMRPPQPAGGAGGATMPTPDRGIEAKALAQLAVHVQALSLIAGVMPVGSDLARDLREALNKIAKHVPPGAISQGVQMSEAQRALMQQKQMGPQIAAMRAAQPAMGGGGPPPGGAPGGPPAA